MLVATQISAPETLRSMWETAACFLARIIAIVAISFVEIGTIIRIIYAPMEDVRKEHHTALAKSNATMVDG